MHARSSLGLTVSWLVVLLMIGYQSQSRVPADQIQDSSSILLQGLITESDLSSIESAIDRTTKQSNIPCSQENCLVEEASRDITFQSKQGYLIIAAHWLEKYAPALPKETELHSKSTAGPKNVTRFTPRLSETMPIETMECERDVALTMCRVVIRYTTIRSILNLYSRGNSSDLRDQEFESLLQEILNAIDRRIPTIESQAQGQ